MARKKRNPSADSAQTTQADGYWVTPGGLGSSLDPVAAAAYQSSRLETSQKVRWFEDQEGLFHRVIALIVDDAVRHAPTITAATADADEEPSASPFGELSDADTFAAIQHEVREWWNCELKAHITQHAYQVRLFGGAALVGIADGVDQSQPRAADVPFEDVRFLSCAPFEIHGNEYESDPLALGFALPKRWHLLSATIDPSWVKVSRTLRVTNPYLSSSSHFSAEALWAGPSVADRVFRALQRYQISVQGIAALLSKVGMRVLKSRAMRDIGAAGNLGNPGQIQNSAASATMQAQQQALRARTAIESRMHQMERAASGLQPVLLDTDETMEGVQTNATAASDLLDAIMVDLAAVSGYPITVLFGVSPSGFGTGEGERKIYAALVGAFQADVIAPALKWALKLRFGDAADDWGITWPALDSPTEPEKIELRNKQAQTDTAYIAAGVLSPAEVARSRFGGGEWSAETQLDDAERAAQAEAEAEIDPVQEPGQPSEAAPAEGEGESPGAGESEAT